MRVEDHSMRLIGHKNVLFLIKLKKTNKESDVMMINNNTYLIACFEKLKLGIN